MNFWRNLQRPIMVLAPMADVTDPAFRRIVAKYGKPDVLWTEFVSADGLFSSGYDVLIKELEFTEPERPIVAQFFTSDPNMMGKAASLARQLGFDGVDINMGCPDKHIVRRGGGAHLIKCPQLAQEIIRAAQQGAGDLPVSVKTRIGWNKNELETLLPALLEPEPALITIHARTRSEMSSVPARWEHVKRAVEIRNEQRSNTFIFGNGDVTSVADGLRKVVETGCDGVMIGRAIFGNPWLFAKQPPANLPQMRLEVLVEHTKVYAELLPHKPFAIMKKHYQAYVTGWAGAKELRGKLMNAKTASAVASISRLPEWFVPPPVI
ncbi:MAG: tRNA-dihydrouridine synthase [Acidobacteria bacterium]|nr:tRNA-dihydrouridine synthase [Acidobacteriota bacterium]